MVVNYTLAYMELPVIDSLSIRSSIPWDIIVTPTNLFFPDDNIPVRLFPNPPSFEIGLLVEGSVDSIEVNIGSFSLSLDFPSGEGERGRTVVMSYITQLAPPSITSLTLKNTDLEECWEWRDFV